MTLSKKSADTLRSVFLAAPKRPQRRFFLCARDGEVARIGDDEALDGELRTLYFPSKHRADFETLRTEVTIALRKQRHTAASPLLADGAIAMAVALRTHSSNEEGIAAFDRTIAIQATVFVGVPDLHVILSEGGFETILGFSLGRFTIGMASQVLHDRLFGKDKVTDQGAFNVPMRIAAWIMREKCDCTTLSAAFDHRIPQYVRDWFLTTVSSRLVMTFNEELIADQKILAAMNLPTINCDELFEIHGLRQDVAFQVPAAIPGAPMATTQNVLLRYPSIFPRGLSEASYHPQIIESLRRKPIGTCAVIDKTLVRFAGFVQKGKAHREAGRPDDAFIHYIIALEILFAGCESISRNVKRRTSVVVHCESQQQFYDTYKSVEDLYNYRSKYVHEGQEVPSDKLDLVARACSATVKCLLRVRTADDADDSQFLEKSWLRRLDYLACAFEAGLGVPDEHYLMCGLNPPHINSKKSLH